MEDETRVKLPQILDNVLVVLPQCFRVMDVPVFIMKVIKILARLGISHRV